MHLKLLGFWALSASKHKIMKHIESMQSTHHIVLTISVTELFRIYMNKVHVCMYVCMCICVYVYIYIYIYIYISQLLLYKSDYQKLHPSLYSHNFIAIEHFFNREARLFATVSLNTHKLL